jgi:uncharacterized repeat protein (TIGR03803 family)
MDSATATTPAGPSVRRPVGSGDRFYGTTTAGGEGDAGVIFQFKPTARIQRCISQILIRSPHQRRWRGAARADRVRQYPVWNRAGRWGREWNNILRREGV